MEKKGGEGGKEESVRAKERKKKKHIREEALKV